MSQWGCQMSSPIISSLKSHVFFLLVGSDRLLVPPFLFLQAAKFKGISLWLEVFPKYVLPLSMYLRLKHLSATCYRVSFLSYFIPTLSQHKLWAAFWFPRLLKKIFLSSEALYKTWSHSRKTYCTLQPKEIHMVRCLNQLELYFTASEIDKWGKSKTKFVYIGACYIRTNTPSSFGIPVSWGCLLTQIFLSLNLDMPDVTGFS